VIGQAGVAVKKLSIGIVWYSSAAVLSSSNGIAGLYPVGGGYVLVRSGPHATGMSLTMFEKSVT